MTTEHRTRTLIGAAAGAAVSALVVWWGHDSFPLVPMLMAPMDRFNFAIGLLPITALPLIAALALVLVAKLRDRPLDHHEHFAYDTAAQTLLAALAQLCLALKGDPESFRLVVTATLWFCLARTTYWYGCHRSPTARAFGFTATLLPNAGILLYCIPRALE